MALADVQATLARLFTDAPFRASFFADPVAVGRANGLDPAEAQTLAALSRNEADDFAGTLRRKRADDVRKVLPLTARALGGAYRHHILPVTAGSPRPGRHRDDAHALVEHLGRIARSGQLEPPWAADLARYEATFGDVLHRRSGILVRRFRYPVARLAAAVLRGDTATDITLRTTVGIWVRWPGRRGIFHRIWQAGSAAARAPRTG
jgi:hypothetical protein